MLPNYSIWFTSFSSIHCWLTFPFMESKANVPIQPLVTEEEDFLFSQMDAYSHHQNSRQVTLCIQPLLSLFWHLISEEHGPRPKRLTFELEFHFAFSTFSSVSPALCLALASPLSLMCNSWLCKSMGSTSRDRKVDETDIYLPTLLSLQMARDWALLWRSPPPVLTRSPYVLPLILFHTQGANGFLLIVVFFFKQKGLLQGPKQWD